MRPLVVAFVVVVVVAAMGVVFVRREATEAKGEREAQARCRALDKRDAAARTHLDEVKYPGKAGEDPRLAAFLLKERSRLEAELVEVAGERRRLGCRDR